jgi:murein DD-endopeptidase MepM/ murein hydrolase activator NlpD
MVAPSSLKAGDIVHGGDEIGQVGNTGHSDGNHLHVEMRVGPSEQIFTTGHYCEVSCADTGVQNTWFGFSAVDPELGW